MSSFANPPPEITKLQETFAGVPFASHGSRWDSCWRQDFSPWDRESPSLALADLVRQRADLVPPAQSQDAAAAARRTALVPGCGRGHDVLLLASLGYDVLGLDYSDAALVKAKENQEAQEASGAYPTPEGVERGRVAWLAGDFFGDEWTAAADVKTFDLIFDYTFLCALPVDARPRWAARMAQLVSPDGRLVCLEFPSGKPPSMPGPPWGLSPEIYEALLAAPGEDISYDADGAVVSTPSPKPSGRALHRLCLVKPLRTHKAGTAEDGTVSDFISVWSR